MKRKLFLLCMIIVQLFATSAFAAGKRTVKGVVVDETGEPLIGATVQVKGTTTGVSCDIDGNFQITAEDGQTLVISYVGYTPDNIVLKGQNDLKIILKSSAELLDDVVVIGYGTMKKKDLTGAVTQIDPAKIADSNPATVQDLLRGTAGLQIGYDPSAKSSASMELRGKNSVGTGSSPLIILDGMQFYGELSEINPDDIKQIDILKDASSAAIYGAAAANGVIIITTKNGGKDGKPTVTLSANWGLNTKSAFRGYFDADGYIQYRSDWYKRDTYGFDENGNYVPYQSGQTNPGYYDYPSEANLNRYGISLDDWMGQSVNQTEDIRDIFGRRIDLNKEGAILDNYINNRTFDWYKNGFRTGLNQDYNVSLSGGTDKMNYYMSFGFMKNEGVIKGNDYKAIRASMRMSGKVTNWLEVGGNVNFQDRSDGDTTYPTSGDYWNANMLRFSPYALFYELDENGNQTDHYNMYPMGGINRGSAWTNHEVSLQYQKLEKGYMVLNSKFFVNITLPFGIKYQFNISPRYQYFWDRYFMSADLPNSNPDDRGVNRSWAKNFDWSLNNTLSWDYTFNDLHHFQVTLAQEAEERKYWNDWIHSRGIDPSDALGFHNTQNGNKKISSFGTNDTRSSADALLARLFYSFDERYMITASVRRDGFSAFGQNKPHAIFPSFALAWNMSNEKFWEGIGDWWNTSKLRLSWGKNGNRNIGQYVALADLSAGQGATMNYLDGNGNVTRDLKYLMMSRMANPNLEWEKTEAFNVGLDFGFLNNRIAGSIDWYYKKTHDMIMAQRLPNFTGFSSITTNLGQVDNTGIELSLNTLNVTNNVLEWTTNFAFSYNDNKIKHLYYQDDIVFDEVTGEMINNGEMNDQSNNWFIGQPLGVIWNYHVDGIWQVDEAEEAARVGQKPGDPKVRNVYTADDIINPDGTVTPVYNDKDREFIGRTTPPVYLSMRNDFTLWKDFLISFSFYSYLGHKSTDYAYRNDDNGGDLITNGMNTWEKEYWTPENPSNTYARLGSAGPAGATGVSRLLNRNFLRLSDVTLGYTLPQKWTRKAYMEKVRFTFGIKNLFTIHHKDWVYGDPETGNLGVRTYNFGINVTF